MSVHGPNVQHWNSIVYVVAFSLIVASELIRLGSQWRRVGRKPAVHLSSRYSSERLAPSQQGHLRKKSELVLDFMIPSWQTHPAVIILMVFFFKKNHHLLGAGLRGCELLQQQETSLFLHPRSFLCHVPWIYLLGSFQSLCVQQHPLSASGSPARGDALAWLLKNQKKEGTV